MGRVVPLLKTLPVGHSARGISHLAGLQEGKTTISGPKTPTHCIFLLQRGEGKHHGAGRLWDSQSPALCDAPALMPPFHPAFVEGSMTWFGINFALPFAS